MKFKKNKNTIQISTTTNTLLAIQSIPTTNSCSLKCKSFNLVNFLNRYDYIKEIIDKTNKLIERTNKILVRIKRYQ
jgi:hypothetical protein